MGHREPHGMYTVSMPLLADVQADCTALGEEGRSREPGYREPEAYSKTFSLVLCPWGLLLSHGYILSCV